MGVLQKRWCWLGCMSYSWQSLLRICLCLTTRFTKKPFFPFLLSIYNWSHPQNNLSHFPIYKDKCLYNSWRFREVKTNFRTWIHALLMQCLLETLTVFWKIHIRQLVLKWLCKYIIWLKIDFQIQLGFALLHRTFMSSQPYILSEFIHPKPVLKKKKKFYGT